MLYDASVRWADDNVGNVIEALKEDGRWDEAIFVFVSDHGEEFFDHDAWFHGQSVYEELVRVPLLIHFPNGEFAGRHIESPVSLVDLMPSLLDYIGRPELCNDCRGSSFMSLLHENPDAETKRISVQAMRHNTSDYYSAWQEARGDVNIVARQGRWKGIYNKDLDLLELYNLDDDPGELIDVSPEQRDIAARMSVAADAWLRDCESRYEYEPKPDIEIDPETRAILESHSYFN